jgi:hypothetical protein
MGSQDIHVASTAGFLADLPKGRDRRFDLQFEERERALSRDSKRLILMRARSVCTSAGASRLERFFRDLRSLPMLARTSFWPIGMVMHFVLADYIARRTYLLLIFGALPCVWLAR